jgi:hypothetical protein
MKTLASALALAALLSLGSTASAATNPPAPFFAAAANSSKLPAKPRSQAGFGGGGAICQGTCTITCSDDSVHEYYDVSPTACCNMFGLGNSACPDGPSSAVFWPTFSTGGECFAIECY